MDRLGSISELGFGCLYDYGDALMGCLDPYRHVIYHDGLFTFVYVIAIHILELDGGNRRVSHPDAVDHRVFHLDLAVVVLGDLYYTEHGLLF